MDAINGMVVPSFIRWAFSVKKRTNSRSDTYTLIEFQARYNTGEACEQALFCLSGWKVLLPTMRSLALYLGKLPQASL